MATEWTGYIPIAEADIERLEEVLAYLADSEDVHVYTDIRRTNSHTNRAWGMGELVNATEEARIRFDIESEQHIPRIIDLMQSLGRNAFN